MSHDERLKDAQAALKLLKSKTGTAQWKPHYHFTAPAGWINDPNGLIYYKGEYHLFYQHNPYGTEWGPMHWGHAVSDDIVHWKHLPIALAPSEPYDDYESGGCFSGSAVQDGERLCLIYTGKAKVRGREVQTQNLAFSEDGVHFFKYEGNPILTGSLDDIEFTDFRDPKVFRHHDKWYLVIGASIGGADNGGDGRVLLYRSENLVHWEFCSELLASNGQWGTMCECPDFFPLGDKWILIFSPTYADELKNVYFVGTMNFENFTYSIEQSGEIDCGFDYYAPQSILDKEGNRVLIAWQNEWKWMPWFNGFGPTSPENWRCCLSVPRVVKLLPNLKLCFKPVKQLENLKYGIKKYNNLVVGREKVSLFPPDASGCEIKLKVKLTTGEMDSAKLLQIRLFENGRHYVAIDIDLEYKTLSFDRNYSDRYSKGNKSCPINLENGLLSVNIWVDKSSVEIYSGGQCCMTNNVYPDSNQTGISLRADCDQVFIENLEICSLKSI